MKEMTVRWLEQASLTTGLMDKKYNSKDRILHILYCIDVNALCLFLDSCMQHIRMRFIVICHCIVLVISWI